MLPPIDTAQLPADVRAAGPDARKAYQAALGFEQQLVTKLAEQLAATAAPEEDEDADGASATTQQFRSMLPGALADGIAANGGLGLARELYRSLPEARS
ncbi:MAG: rod-binding protein [Thermoleophilia bacterium]